MQQRVDGSSRAAHRLRDLTAQHNVLLALNDRADLARLVHADIVHVGQDDLSVQEARRIGGAGLLVGKSTHTLEQFAAALVEDADYLAVGPMFPSDTKPQEHIAGPPTLAAARPRTALPLVAIGGITTDNAAQVVAAGASAIAVCTAVISASDPEAAARTLCASMSR